MALVNASKFTPGYLNLEFFFDKFFTGMRIFFEKAVKFGEWLNTPTFKIISALVSVWILYGIVVTARRLIALNKNRISAFEKSVIKKEEIAKKSEEWDKVKSKVGSDNSADWKIAIMEADSLIDKIMKKIGYEGGDLGERLKSIEPSDFENLQSVWEAHKLRNRIAHEAGYVVTKTEAVAVIEKYENALAEFGYFS